MILLGREHTCLPVSYPKVGRRFSIMQLNQQDFTDLRKLTPEQLKGWLELWALGFDPSARDPRFVDPAQWYVPPRGD